MTIIKLKKNNIINVIFILFFTQLVSANDEVILSQGSINVSISDIDGFAYKIPEDKRHGFFESPQRIDSTLYNMLNMKHIVKYGDDNKILDMLKINEAVDYSMLSYADNTHQENSIFLDNKYSKLKSYITLEVSYKYMVNHIKNTINEDELIELAEEEYLINKDNYFKPETRDIDYISILYTEENVLQQKAKAVELLSHYKNKLTIDEISENFKSDHDVEIAKNLNEFKYSEKYLEFSDFIYATNKTGVINEIFDAKNRFIIINLKNINHESYTPFSEVKKAILNKLMKKKSERKFQNLLAQLTKDEVDINQQALISIKTRFSK